jgi:tetratricopeptide (TPR) repeat protein
MALVVRVAPAQTGQLDASPTLFTVMAAINAAGYDAEIASPNNSPLRSQIRQELAQRRIPSLAAIREFVRAHHHNNSAAELSQYISFALTVGPPPRFLFRQRDVDLPPDVSGMVELGPLLAAFYKEANIEELWKRAQPAIDQAIERYHEPVTQAVLQVNTYLRQVTSGFQGYRFQVFLELQAAPNEIQTRAYGNQYTIVITPSPEIKAFEVRHGYLHYSLDPLTARSKEVLERRKLLAEQLKRAPLDSALKEDFPRLAGECMIKAIEARLDKRPERVEQELRQGYILTPFFWEKLADYEKQPAAMLVYYLAMVSAIDSQKEYARLEKVVFDAHPAPPHTVPVVVAAPEPVVSGAAKTLDEAEQLYLKRDLEKAKALYLRVLQETDQKPMHAAAYYGVARIAALEKDPETAERMFQKVLDLDPEPPVKAWTLVYLGRLSLATTDGAPQAAKYFREALVVKGASEAAQNAARQGIEQSSK